MPKQIDYDTFLTLDGIGDTASKASTAMVIVPFVLQIVLKGAMKRIWAFFMMLQLLMTFPRMDLGYPENVMAV